MDLAKRLLCLSPITTQKGEDVNFAFKGNPRFALSMSTRHLFYAHDFGVGCSSVYPTRHLFYAHDLFYEHERLELDWVYKKLKVVKNLMTRRVDLVKNSIVTS
jgi:hypothetical protein